MKIKKNLQLENVLIAVKVLEGINSNCARVSNKLFKYNEFTNYEAKIHVFINT